jgi:hypothetical protein
VICLSGLILLKVGFGIDSCDMVCRCRDRIYDGITDAWTWVCLVITVQM